MDTIGVRAAELLNYDVVDKALITEVARSARVAEEEVAEIDEVEEPGIRGFLSRWFSMENLVSMPSSSLVDLSYHGGAARPGPCPAAAPTRRQLRLRGSMSKWLQCRSTCPPLILISCGD